ncbi:GGDEF domain-containing protein [Helicovermis profundi]|uniref:GGDEF domain-containing protein n=1 Tax=Helicovermis profundi TaxID=3065157 RepID=A0AAU9E8P1_9FIRM|nr:GGDEF domain-containing protein [Clostridia bacterium S502]
MDDSIKKLIEVRKLLDINSLFNAQKINSEIFNKAINEGNNKIIVKTLYNFGIIFERKGDYKTSFDYYEKASKNALMYDFFDDFIDIQNSIAYLISQSGKYKLSLAKYKELLELIDKDQKLISKKALLLNNSAIIYKELGKLDLALDFYMKCIELKSKHDDRLLDAIVYYNIAEIFCEKKEFEKAKTYLIKSYKVSESINDYLGIHMCKTIDAIISIPKDLNKSLSLFKDSKKNVEKFGSKYNVLDIVYDYSISLYELGYKEQAIKYLEKLEKEEIIQSYYLKARKILSYLENYYADNDNIKKAYFYSKKRVLLKKNLIDNWDEIEVNYLKNSFINTYNESQMKELKGTIKIMETLSKIGESITKGENFDDIFQSLSRNLNILFKIDLFGVGVIKKDKLLYRYTDNEKNITSTFELDDYTKLMNISIRDGKEILILDTEKIHEYENKFDKKVTKRIFNSNARSIIFCPVYYEYKIIGSVTVQSRENYTFNYLDLEKIRFLSSYIGIAIVTSQKSEKLIEVNKQLDILSKSDALTKLFNRHALTEYIENNMNYFTKKNMPLGICMLDIDYFKEYNDNYGHVAGDSALKKIADLTKLVFDSSNIHIFRYGGDEFLIITENITLTNLKKMLDELLKKVKHVNIKHEFSKAENILTVTLGGIVTSNLSLSQMKLFNMADEVLYEAKNMKRNSYIIKNI